MGNIRLHPIALGLALVAALPLLSACSKFENGTYKPMQEDFDRIRVKDARYLFDLAIQYKTQHGVFPFEHPGDSLPTVVIFETEGQAGYHKDKYPIMVDMDTRFADPEQHALPGRINILHARDFYAEVDKDGAKGYKYKFDPQKVPVHKPCVYIYVVYNGIVDVSCFLHQGFEFTRNLSPDNNKFAFTSAPKSLPAKGLWTPDEASARPDFAAFYDARMNKPGIELKLEADNQPARTGAAP